MATRIRTVEYFLGARNTSLNSSTRHDFAAVSVTLDNASGRTFRTAVVRVGVRDNVTTATSLTSPLIGIKIDAVAFSDATLGNPPGNTGENGHYIFERDVTSYFTTNFTGTTHNVQCGVQFAGPSTINHVAKLILTYEYDDTFDDMVKTVRIPIESPIGALTATLADVGVNQIPALDTFCTEGTKVYRSIWIEAFYNESNTGTTNDSALGISVGGGAEQQTGIHESGLASSCSGWYLFNQGATPTWSTASVQAIRARSSNVTTAATFNHVGFILHVTYSFKISTTTTWLNSLMLAMPPIHTAGATVTADQSEQVLDFAIPEPDTITQVQSGMLIWYSQSGNVGPQIRLGSQATRAYTDLAQVYCGASFLVQRTDLSGAQGSAWTLVRGNNKLEWGVFIGTAGTTAGAFGGILYLNYTSPIDFVHGGPGAHNQSLYFAVQDSQASGNISTIAAKQAIYLPDTYWYRNNFGFLSNNVQGAVNTPAGYVAFEVESASGELTEGGWETEGICYITTESELGWYPALICVTAQSKGDWDRWASDPDATRMSLTASRRWKVITGQSGTRPMSLLLTKHSLVWDCTGTVSGSAGGTVNLHLHYHNAPMEHLASTTRVGNGSYTIKWYHNLDALFVQAYEGDPYQGRSSPGGP
jgi:hypothetical protein